MIQQRREQLIPQPIVDRKIGLNAPSVLRIKAVTEFVIVNDGGSGKRRRVDVPQEDIGHTEITPVTVKSADSDLSLEGLNIEEIRSEERRVGKECRCRG